MNKNTILECMYKVIKDSLEWGITEKEYGMFVDGVVAMTEKLIEDTRLEDRVKEVEEHFEKAVLDDSIKNHIDEYEYSYVVGTEECTATTVDETMTTLIGSI